MDATYHHGMPKRSDQGMTAKHLHRKLGTHPGDAHICGQFQIEGGKFWMVAASSNHTVEFVRDFLKNDNRQMSHIDLTVTVDLKKQQAKVRAAKAARQEGGVS